MVPGRVSEIKESMVVMQAVNVNISTLKPIAITLNNKNNNNILSCSNKNLKS